MSSSNSPCAACKFLRRKCTQECVFAPYFPPDQPQKFANVHKVFGASNVAKLLNELATNLREDAVNSLAYEAEARLRDPVYGCVGLISILQHRLKQVQSDLYSAKKELATYIGPQAMMPMLQAQAFMPQQHLGNPSSSTVIQHGMVPMMGIPTGSSHSGQLVIRDPQHQHQHNQQQQQMFEAQQLAAAVAAKEQQEMLRSYEQQQELVRFNSGFDAPTGFNNQMSGGTMSPSLALGGFDNSYQIQAQQQPAEHHHHHATAHPLQAQLLQQQPPPPPQTQQQQKSPSEEAKLSSYLRLTG
ncbi:LOB domain-containing protein 36 isoform X2 [Citrus sinensis]|uniref:LOB domain-containing protein 36 n=1 Tax=Citrus clementina TaxID=85681 RepID=UPI000CED468F|nr:LOB domain-containing protein 36 [Citrus x clementina]XP_052287174.1 LOB domain-containing protein 36 isoform X2 [Citrus sinensis]